MLSVIIGADENEEGLARTLASLVPAVVAGVLNDAVVIDAETVPAIAAIADAAGCGRIVGSIGEGLPRALAELHTDWVLLLKPGTVLEDGWFREAAEFVERARLSGKANKTCAAFTYASQDYGVAGRLAEFRRFLGANLFGRVVANQGLIIAKSRLREISAKPVTRLPPRPPAGARVVVLRSRAFSA